METRKALAIYCLLGCNIPHAQTQAVNGLPDRWIALTKSVDRMDGKETLQVLAPARTVSYRRPRQPLDSDKISNLVVSCSKGKPVVYVELRNQLIAGYNTRVTYKFDNEKPVERRAWETSTDNTAAGYWGGKNATLLIRGVENSKTMLVRIENDVFGTMEAFFETSNARPYFEPLKKACRW